MRRQLMRFLSIAILAAATATTSFAGDWNGYMNVFDKLPDGSQGGYVFGSNWGVADLKTTLIATPGAGTNIANNSMDLFPNYSTYNAADPFWADGAVGNKWMEANSFVETNPVAVTGYTLQGTVDANDLDTNLYSAEAFIKVLDPNASFATVLNDRVALPASGPFVVTSDLSLYQGMILQTGFTVNGLNANPVNEAAFGGVTLTVVPEPATFGLAAIGIASLAGFRRRSRR